MNLSDLDMHDARLLSLAQDFAARHVDIRMAYYPAPGVQARVEGVLRFRGVRNLQQLVDFDLLATHAGFGNITQLVVGETPNTIQLILARGLIVVVADSVELV